VPHGAPPTPCGQPRSNQVNKRYRLLEIELDAIFRTMLLLKKKKYAAIKVGTWGGVNSGV
jgi:DNA polymerase alpha subunit A